MKKRETFKVSLQALLYNDSSEILLLKRSSTISYGNLYCLPVCF